MKHKLFIEENAEGDMLAILGPINTSGEIDHGLRIAGPKAWGGSDLVAELTVSDDDLINYIEEYAPHIIAQLVEVEVDE